MVTENSKQRAQLWVGVLISILCLAAIFLLIDPGEILDALRTAHYGYLGLSAVGIVAFLILRAIRWRFILNNQVAWGQVFHIQNIGYLLTYILPFRLGDVIRAVLIGNVPPVTVAQGISTMVVERVLDLLFVVVLLPLTLTSLDTIPDVIRNAAYVFAIFAFAAILVLVLAANRRSQAHRLATWVLDRVPFLENEVWLRRFDQLLTGLDSLTRLKDGVTLLALSVLVWGPIIWAYYMGMRAVQLQPTLAMAGFVVCAAALSISAPSSPGQVGVFHAGVIFAMTQVLRLPQGASASFAFLYHALNLVTVALFGIIGVYRIGTTLSNVIETGRALMRRNRKQEHAGV